MMTMNLSSQRGCFFAAAELGSLVGWSWELAAFSTMLIGVDLHMCSRGSSSSSNPKADLSIARDVVEYRTQPN